MGGSQRRVTCSWEKGMEKCMNPRRPRAGCRSLALTLSLYSLCPCVLDPWPSCSSWEVETGLCRQWECSPPSPTLCALPLVPSPHHMQNHARRLGISWPPILLMEDDWECRLWEETTIFIVWIKYFSWPSCYLVTVLLFSSFPILSHSLPPLSISPSSSLSHPSSAIKHTEKF